MDLLSDDDHREFAEALLSFGGMVMETREVAGNLSRGELNIKLPPSDNELAAPLKALHSTLKHLTWQTKQVALGDYEQHVGFMGEFSEAFNDMISQLASQRIEIKNENRRNEERMEELAKTNSIFQIITSSMEEWIVMVDRETGEHLFANHSSESMLVSDTFEKQLYDIIFEYAGTQTSDSEPRKEEFILISDEALQYFEMMIYPIHWFDHNAIACVLTDVTASKEEYNRLEDAAYKDIMTGSYNRLYGMKMLDQFHNEKVPYRLIFVDMDMLKYVNDVFGHLEGDAYIKSVADILQKVSPLATVCRLGGDEFMVLLQERDVRGRDIQQVLEDLRAELVSTSTYDENGKLMYNRSISFGIVDVGTDKTMDKSDVLTLADDRMYEYKKAHKKERRV
jgi:diguanylate cyclase (GGDEF)-like protein